MRGAKQDAHGRTEIVPMIEMAAKAAICLAMILKASTITTSCVFLAFALLDLLEVASTYVGISMKLSFSALHSNQAKDEV